MTTDTKKAVCIFTKIIEDNLSGLHPGSITAALMECFAGMCFAYDLTREKALEMASRHINEAFDFFEAHTGGAK